MGTRPIIGISGRRITAAPLGVPAGFRDAPVDAYFSEYATAVHRAGGVPVHLALDSDPDAVIAHVDGVLLAGGEDVDPVRYGRRPGPLTTWIDPGRDAFEIAVFEAAVAAGVPVLGICRGAQLINVARGGSLITDLPVGTGESHASYAYPRTARRHAVTFQRGSAMWRLYGPSATVNSFHHQAVDAPGSGVEISGVADDGVAESIEIPGLAVIGVQWHPECFGADPVFDWLVGTSNRGDADLPRVARRDHAQDHEHDHDDEDVA
ncbi:gamma-glutamyl-gamma-aminobutyrate hydrolase family protein [Mycolicibacterium sp.]|uniref:gamma-glutamyl-gamma-aminobutyrate hydrolase family protein n=1 Tax=Mycolicibacterium sp. TaxID=2320850 RepID=UPI003D12450F